MNHLFMTTYNNIPLSTFIALDWIHKATKHHGYFYIETHNNNFLKYQDITFFHYRLKEYKHDIPLNGNVNRKTIEGVYHLKNSFAVNIEDNMHLMNTLKINGFTVITGLLSQGLWLLYYNDVIGKPYTSQHHVHLINNQYVSFP